MNPKKTSDFSADFIVIGSGLGGLCAAAYLSRANYRVIVLEKNSEIGGKCATRTMNGYRYVIGANTFGSRTAFILKDLGINIEWIPAASHFFSKNGKLQFPLSFSSIKELKTFGLNFPSLLIMCGRFCRLLVNPPSTIKTYRDYIDYFVRNVEARELPYIEAWYIGAHPDWLPPSAFKLFLGTYYGYHKTIYPLQGAHAIPNAFTEYIKTYRGEVFTGQNVTEIGIENETVHGVQAGNQWFSAKYAVISDAEISQTLAMLKTSAKSLFTNSIHLDTKSAFPFALLLLILDASKAPDSITKANPLLETNATFITRPICDLFDELNDGQINDFPVFNLILSDLKAQILSGSHLHHLPVHVSVLWPKSISSRKNFDTLTQSILKTIDIRYPGFAQSVLSSQWITPEEYEKRFGFSSNPAPVLETPTYTKHSWKLPIKGLYNVGTTVQPSGSHAGCAIESGLCCAKDILNNI